MDKNDIKQITAGVADLVKKGMSVASGLGKVDFIKMNKQQIRDRSAKVHTQKFLGQVSLNINPHHSGIHYSSTLKTTDEFSSQME